ncbi:MAG: alpha-galactosidase, partial [Bacteroidales bacterium]|nr:alpha-galactosidase [Bacteroidales bacterium]
MRTIVCYLFILMALSSCRQADNQQTDWLIDNSAFVSTFSVSQDGKDLILSNGLVSRVFRSTPNLATISFNQLSTGQNHIRATRPEGSLVIDGVSFNIGGLYGQPVQNYLQPSWIDSLSADRNSFQYTGYSTQAVQKRFEWAKRAEWLSQDAAWPPAGTELILHFKAPETPLAKGLTAHVHYEIYDGLPLICKWISLENHSGRNVTLNRFTSEIMAAVEGNADVDITDGWTLPNIHVETDYAFKKSITGEEKEHTVHWVRDTSYTTQISYLLNTPCLLEVRPSVGPQQLIADGQSFDTFRTWELLYDSHDKERKLLSKRKMYRVIAPWALENPVIMHVRHADKASVKLAIDQCAETGFEMVIMTFGSGFDM